MVFQSVAERCHAQGAEQPFRDLRIRIAVAADEIAIVIGLVALYLNAEEVGDLLTVAVEGAYAEFLAVDIARRLRPVVTNLLYRHAATLHLANQPTIEFCPVVHNQYSKFFATLDTPLSPCASSPRSSRRRGG